MASPGVKDQHATPGPHSPPMKSTMPSRSQGRPFQHQHFLSLFSPPVAHQKSIPSMCSICLPWPSARLRLAGVGVSPSLKEPIGYDCRLTLATYPGPHCQLCFPVVFAYFLCAVRTSKPTTSTSSSASTTSTSASAATASTSATAESIACRRVPKRTPKFCVQRAIHQANSRQAERYLGMGNRIDGAVTDQHGCYCHRPHRVRQPSFSLGARRYVPQRHRGDLVHHFQDKPHLLRLGGARAIKVGLVRATAPAARRFGHL